MEQEEHHHSSHTDRRGRCPERSHPRCCHSAEVKKHSDCSFRLIGHLWFYMFLVCYKASPVSLQICGQCREGRGQRVAGHCGDREGAAKSTLNMTGSGCHDHTDQTQAGSLPDQNFLQGEEMEVMTNQTNGFICSLIK